MSRREFSLEFLTDSEMIGVVTVVVVNTTEVGAFPLPLDVFPAEGVSVPGWLTRGRPCNEPFGGMVPSGVGE